MKNKKYILGICISLLVLVGNINIAHVQGAKPGRSSLKYKCELIHGEYTDLDEDGLTDDLRIIAHLDLIGGIDWGETLYMYMYLAVYLPSGEILPFAWKVTVYVLDDYTLEFHVLNGATESGWYTCYLYLEMENSTPWSDSSVIIFDPPKIARNGDPTCSVYIW